MTRRSTRLHVSSKQKSRPTPTSTLLELPGEIRNKIYQSVLSQHPNSSTTFTYPPSTLPLEPVCLPGTSPSCSPQQPPLAQTCRQLRHELLSILYGNHTISIDRAIGTQNLIPTFAKTLRPSLFYLRSIQFTLFTEFTAWTPDLENSSPGGLCEAVTVNAWLTDNDKLDFDVKTASTCVCKFARCARDVEAGVLGDRRDALLVRYLRALDISDAKKGSGEGVVVCTGCGLGNVQVSLRDIRGRVGR